MAVTFGDHNIYDIDNRVIGVSEPLGVSLAYSYDVDGNDDNSGDSDGTDNELLSDGTNNYTYDSAGNEVSKTNIATGDVWTYYYNSQNAMTQALETTSPGTGGVMEQDIFYRYDAFGNMIQKEVVTGGMSGTDTFTDYAVDGWNPALAGATGNSNFNTWAVLNVSGSSTTLQTRNLFGDQVDEIIARIDQTGASDSAGVYWDLTDKLGSVRTVLNGSGTVVDTINYDAYGNTTSETDAADQGMYGWTGQEKDLETGLQYNNARWYDSFTGRWISQDPLGFDAGDSNLYRYANNAPTDDSDPSGMQPPPATDYSKRRSSDFAMNNAVAKGKLVEGIGVGIDRALESIGNLWGGGGTPAKMQAGPVIKKTADANDVIGRAGDLLLIINWNNITNRASQNPSGFATTFGQFLKTTNVTCNAAPNAKTGFSIVDPFTDFPRAYALNPA